MLSVGSPFEFDLRLIPTKIKDLPSTSIFDFFLQKIKDLHPKFDQHHLPMQITNLVCNFFFYQIGPVLCPLRARGPWRRFFPKVNLVYAFDREPLVSCKLVSAYAPNVQRRLIPDDVVTIRNRVPKPA